ncbi:hypothetical protein LAZ67_21000282 [Cordylochernes scorpioides]|uniref:Mariner Mos1 transposase n=1 Tax=Cordylochernes scorpioides TaxID=51811 RepID=A0ABY6LNR1_9ARAC|nr:hypothetical protein LAZ67_21000282 [Cordylochernes scorpioides]
MLEMVEENPNWKEKVITGDETWVYGYDPETKRQSMEWKGKDEPKTKKSRLCKSKNKVLLVTFFDIKGIVHYGYLDEGTYSPDLAPSDYHLSASLGHALKNQEFSNSDILRKWLVDWFDSKGIEFFRQGIRKLPEKWSECIANQGNYFE